MKKPFRKKSANAVTIIGGNDGPTSVFIAGKTGRKRENPVRRLQNQLAARRHQQRRARVMQSIKPEAHTPDELAAFIREKYHAAELPPESFRVREACRNTKISIVWRDHREKLAQLGYISPDQKCPPDFRDRAAVKEWYSYMQEYDNAAAGMDDALVPLDFHFYEIRLKPRGKTEIAGTLQVALERVRGLLSVGFSSSDKRALPLLQKIQKNIYRYYGVTAEDIQKNTDRYLTLITVLMDQPAHRKKHRPDGRQKYTKIQIDKKKQKTI